MKKSTMITVLTSVFAAVAGIFVYKSYQEKTKQEALEKDVDMHNSQEIDKRESVEADEDDAEKGLTQLDSAYRDEWQANAFPQTHREMEELEKDK
ncbi:hypothetical protein [Planococcus halotolerans]|uniref:Uncharacterized protein n=1 Tax=Planococcus halotolerans TaxID=2233542 RepID=A0A365KR84_9BACL|nr:hypothetical protein [Planococcus halotolerans]QHJ69393.1 hypothetical protein DNR44_001550 [Planococcus halotolerans]RAZ75625.1 hypothetical protein DP120_12525 [Planococcus halotolerans]